MLDRPPTRGQVTVRRRLLGRPVDRVPEAEVDRLVCLSGVLVLIGPGCVLPEREIASLSVVDEGGLRLVCRSAGRIALRCGEEMVELVGEVGVVVGSREESSLWDGQVLRIVEDGTPVRARGMLRRGSRALPAGYRGSAHGYALQAFGTHRILDVACDARPRRMGARLVDELGAWAHLRLVRGLQEQVLVATGDA